MEKKRDIKDYIDTVRNNEEFFLNYYYHSIIDSNLVKLDLMLKNGILSKRLIEEYGLPNLYTHSADSWESTNGNDYISLVEFKEGQEFSTLFDAFAFHTLTSLSLMVDKKINISLVGKREVSFSDEVFGIGKIAPDNIKGIILPEHLTDLRIKDICPLPNDLACYRGEYLANWAKEMENYFDSKIPSKEIKTYFESFWNIYGVHGIPTKEVLRIQREKYGVDLRDVLASILEKLWEEKLALSEPKYLEVIKIINDNQVPIYEIKKKELVIH